MKLEIKHLVSYLPYDLQIANKSLSGLILNTYTMMIENTFDEGILNVINGVNQIPILYPLSYLTKEIEFDGELIKPIDYISTSIQDAQKTMRRIVHELPLDTLEYWKIERLCKLHFDFQNLIPNGLAIDKTTI